MSRVRWLSDGWGRRAALAFAVLLALSAAGAARLEAAARMVPQSLAELAQKLSPAVVNISTSQTLPGGAGADDEGIPDEGAPFEGQPGIPALPGRPEKVQSLGSGFVIDPAGIIVTNNHVIEGADRIDVTFSDGTTLPAKVRGRDEKTDIAVLKVEAKRPLSYVTFGDSRKLRVGDWVVAIGNPFGLGGSVTTGIVSALNRDIHAGNYDDFIQTDAAINRGNSGGPLFSLGGEVIGMNTAIISPSGESVGIGFATPSSTIAPIVDQILRYGQIRRGWIGVRIQSVSPEIAATLGLADAHGALVAGVTPGGPAAAAGIETGDLVTAFDGQDIREMRDLPRIVAETEIGKQATIVVMRAGKEMRLKIRVAKLVEADEAAVAQKIAPPPAQEKVQILGLDLLAATPDVRARFKLDAGTGGAVVAGVKPSSAAEGKGVKPGDVIVEAGQTPVKGPQDVVAAVNDAKKAGRKSVLLRLLSGGSSRFAAVPVE